VKRSPAVSISIPVWIWALLGLTGFCLAWKWIKNEDLGFQLHAAKLILQTGDVARGEPFLWTEPGGSYTDLQWLWQLGIYGCWRWLGYGGLMVVNFGIQLVALGFWAWRVFRMGSRPLGLGSLWLLLIFFCVNIWPIRPHNLSWIYLGMTLLVLEEHFRGNRRALWFLPLISLAWVNCHALFSLGLLASALWILGDIVLQIRRQGWRLSPKEVVKASWPVGLAALACLINPYGWQGLVFPFHQARIVAGNHVASDMIHEFQPLRRAIFPEEGLSSVANYFDSTTMLILLFLLLSGLVLGRKKVPAVAWTPIAIFTFLAFRMVKNFNYFFILVGPYAAVGWDAFLARRKPGIQSLIRGGAVAICLFFCLAVPIGLWSNLLWGMPFGVGLEPKVHPSEISEVLGRTPQQLRVLNGHDNGGWIGWISGKRVFLDGRNDNYSEELLRSYGESVEKREAFVALLDRWQIEAVVARYDSEPLWVPTLIELTRRSKGYFKDSVGRPVPLWRCVARDTHTALFFRYDANPSAPENRSFAPGFDSLRGREDKLDEILRMQAEKKEAGWRRIFFGVEAFPVDLNLLVARSVDFGEYAAAKSYAVKGMEICPWFFPNLWSNLAYVFEMEGDTERADFCWRTIAQKTSDPKWKQKEVRALERRGSHKKENSTL
jgi:hypothetical protein